MNYIKEPLKLIILKTNIAMKGWELLNLKRRADK
jgi:hypothetical protein